MGYVFSGPAAGLVFRPKPATVSPSGPSRGRRIKPVTIDAPLARIAAANHRLNAFTDLVDQGWESRNGVAPARPAAAAGDALPLDGLTFAFKNLYDFAGLTTRAGSAILADNPPATEDAAAVRSAVKRLPPTMAATLPVSGSNRNTVDW